LKVFGWLADHSGCGWYRLVLPLGQLRQAGHETTWSRRITQEAIEESDVIVCQRTCLVAPSLRYRELAEKRGRNYLLVYEVDDDLLSVDSLNPAARVFAEPEVRAALIANARAADLVTVSTEPLAQVMRRLNPNVVVLPNAVPQDMLSWRTGRQENVFTVGWQGGPTHDRDWQTAAEPVKRWFEATRASHLIQMHTIGAIPDHTDQCPRDCRRTHFPEIYPHRHTDWNPDIPRYYRTMDWHVALAPLAPTRFNRSKSPLRALEAAMLGFPVIASNVEAYGQFVRHGTTGYLVDRASDWDRYLTELLNDPDAREEMGAAARALAHQHTIEATAHLWEKAYGSA
jgi:glycosyltransferase involved in cell wall biosynthesis